jgi:hypothetical protein
MTSGVLRPFERRVLALTEAGLDRDAIAEKFKRSPEFIGRVLEMTRLPRPGSGARRADGPLNALERRVLRWRDGGASFDDIGRRFHRSPEHMERVAGLADYKLGRPS